MASPKCVLLSAAIAGCFAPVARADEKAAEREFALKVLPLLKAKCFACHGEGDKAPKGGLDVRTRAALLKGGDTGTSLAPGKPDASLLYKAVKWDGIEMPPKENDRLSAVEVELVRKWIAAGAPWPDDAAQKTYRDEERKTVLTADGTLVKTSGGLSDEWTYRRYKPEDVWAFQPVKKPAIAGAKGTNPIDHFVHATLAKAGATPAPRADPRTLIRRATFDLIGLPPTPDEIETFLAAWKADPTRAWESLIDRLLASPHYGERWAQHWFDVARYADTGGMANDYERSNVWRYRDYVIRSFNADKPYNRFVTEQLAGDELADASALKRAKGDAAKLASLRASGEYTEEEAEWIVATSFLRMGPWDNAMIKPAQSRQIYLDDVVNAVGQTFLATTMRCFKCHDHKFDPLPTRDYYRVYAAFAGTQMAERPLRFTRDENRDGFDEGRAFVETMLKYATAEKEKIVAKREAAARKWYDEHKLPYKTADARKSDPDEKKPPRNVGLDHTDEGQLKVREQDEWIWQRALERYQPMVNAVYDGADTPLAWNGARKLRMPAKVNQNAKPDSHILMGGVLEAPGAKVQPGVFSALGVPVEGAKGDPFVLPEDITQRRLGLAKWITDPRNPLTTRAIVNRVWQYHFGKPLAGNPNNFGVKGAKPTHPELLDWLAADFVDNGWTLKRLHRLIMTSQAYQMASSHPQAEKLRTTDANNDRLAFFPTRLKRSLVEELSGREFEYDEILPVFEKYVRDTKPADVSAETRALADLCLLLLNSNEFIYLY